MSIQHRKSASMPSPSSPPSPSSIPRFNKQQGSPGQSSPTSLSRSSTGSAAYARGSRLPTKRFVSNSEQKQAKSPSEAFPAPPTTTPQVVSTSVSRFGKGRRKNSVFEVVEIVHSEAPSQPDGPDLIIKEDPTAQHQAYLSDSSNSDGQDVLSSPPESTETSPTTQAYSTEATKLNLEEKRLVRSALIQRLVTSSGEKVLDGVDVNAILSLDRAAGQPAAQGTEPEPVPTKADIPTEKKEAAPAPKTPTTPKKGMFGLFKSKKNTPTSIPQPSTGRSVSAPSRSQPTTPATEKAPPIPQVQGAVFGCSLSQLPEAASCFTVIAQQPHHLPIVTFATVEEMYRRGICTPALFRIQGSESRIAELVKIYDKGPHYGDGHNLSQEPIENIAALFKQHLRELADPVFEPALYPLFVNACLRKASPLAVRLQAAQTILRLLPQNNFSLFVYLLAFLCQLTQHQASNGLSAQSLSIILGPAIFAPRIPGLPIGSVSKRSDTRSVEADDASHRAQAALLWTVEHWQAICSGEIPASITPEEEPATDDSQSVLDDVLRDSYGRNSIAMPKNTAAPVVEPSSWLAAGGKTEPAKPVSTSRRSSRRSSVAVEATTSSQSHQSGAPVFIAPLARRKSSAPDIIDSPIMSWERTRSQTEPGLQAKRSSISSSAPSTTAMNRNQSQGSSSSQEKRPIDSAEQDPPRVSSVASLRQPATPTQGHASKESTASYHGTFGQNGGLASPLLTDPPIVLHQAEQSSLEDTSLDRSTSVCGKSSPCHQQLNDLKHSNEKLRSEIETLLGKVASQESSAIDERERYMNEVKLARNEMKQLREALQSAEQRNTREQDSLVTQWKREAEQSKAMAEKSSQDFERLMQQVVSLTKERDDGRKKLRAVKKAISFSSREGRESQLIDVEEK